MTELIVPSLLSQGYPWDWQSGNAKYPVYNRGYDASKTQEFGYTTKYISDVTLLHANNNVTIEVDDSALLPCIVKNLAEYTVINVQNSITTYTSATFRRLGIKNIEIAK